MAGIDTSKIKAKSGGDLTITDDNDNETLVLKETSSAVNEVAIANAQTGNGPSISSQGDDTNVDLHLNTKGTGAVAIRSSYLRVDNGSTGPGELRIYEDSDDGNHYFALKAKAMAASLTYVLPDADGSNGQQLTTDGSGNLSWTNQGASGGSGAATDSSNTFTEAQSIAKDVDGEFQALILKNNDDDDDADGAVSLRFDLEAVGGAAVQSGKIKVTQEGNMTATASTQDTKMHFFTTLNGTLTDQMQLSSAGVLAAKELDISGNVDVDGTLEADAITVDGTALATVIAGVTVANATTAAVATTVTITDNENTNEENAVVFTAGGDVDGGNIGLESDGDLTYNPSTGTLTATIFKGNIDAVDGDFDGTLEADAITVGGTNLLTGGLITSLGTITQDTVTFTSANANDPVVIIQNTKADAAAPRLKFNKNRGGDAVDGDDVGDIQFWSYDDGTPSVQQYAGILAEVHDATSGEESGKLTLQVASHDGDIESGLVLTGGSTDGEVDVTIAAGGNSVTTIAGSLLLGDNKSLAFGDDGDASIKYDQASSDALLIDGKHVRIDGNNKLQFRDAALTINSSSDGQLDLEADTTIAFTTPDVLFTSTTSQKPLFTIQNLTNDAEGSKLKFIKNRGSNNGANNDVCGIIEFEGTNNASEQHTFAQFKVTAANVTNGQEGGKIQLLCANHDGDMEAGLVIEESSTDATLNVTVGNGASSTVTVPGSIDLAGDIDVDGTTNLDAVDIDGNVNIAGGSSLGGNSLDIVHTDVDTKAVNITASQTTGNIIDITADDCLTSGKVLHMDINDASTTAITPSYIHLDFDKDGTVGDGVASTFTGFNLDMHDAATNHANSTVTMVGLDIDITGADTDGNVQGDIKNTGIAINITGADTQFNRAIHVESGHIQLNDNQSVVVGTGGDLVIQHNATNSILQNTTGHLVIENTPNDKDVKVKLGNTDGSTAFKILDSGDNVEITLADNGNLTITGELDAATGDFSGNVDIAGDLTLSAGGDGALVFGNAGENSIKIPDGQANALIIEEANNAYITITTTNSQEEILFSQDMKLIDDKKLTFGSNDDASIKYDEAQSDSLMISIPTAGLTLINNGTGDNQFARLNIMSSEEEIAANETIGQIDFQVIGEGSGGASNEICASIQAKAFSAFTDTANETSLQFFTAVGEDATSNEPRMIIEHNGSLNLHAGTTAANGDGFNGNDGTGVKASLQEINNEIVTTIKIDIDGFTGAVGDGKIIGDNGASNAFITRLSKSVNGLIYKVQFICTETVAGSATTQLDLYVKDDTPTQGSSMGGTHMKIIETAGNVVAGMFKETTGPAFTATSGGTVPDGLDTMYLYLTTGTNDAGTSAGAYTAGKVIIRLYGVKEF